MSHDVVESIYEGRLVTLRIERARLPTGAEIDLEIVRHKGAAAVAAVDEQDRVVLIRQYRYAADGFIWEIPAGVLKSEDEPPAACAVRELREEVGLTAREWTQLGSIFTTPGFTNEQIHLFLARGLEHVGHARDDDEVIEETRAISIGEALAMVRRGEIVDGKTVVCLYLAADALRVVA
jgi:ADP-ribose pyrophosphatase